MNENFVAILQSFRLDAEPVTCEPYGCGHINGSYLVVTTSGRRYILQRINHQTFKDVAGLMENITSITEFLRKKSDDPRSVLTLVKTLSGESYLRAQAAYWRVLEFTEGTICLQAPESDEDFYQSAIGFGTFQVNERAARMGRNPQTKEEIEIAASKQPVFKAGAALKKAVN